MCKKITAIILCFCILLIFPNPRGNYITAEQTIADIQKEIKENNDKIANLDKALADSKDKSLKAEDYRNLVMDKLDTQNKNLIAIQKQIDSLQTEIDKKTKSIADLSVDIANQEALISNEITVFKKRLVAMYTSDTTDIAMILSGTSDFIDILSRFELIESIAQQDKKMVDSLTEKLTKLTDNKTILETESLELQVDKEQALEKQSEFMSIFDSLNREIADVNAELAVYALEQEEISSEITVYNDRNEDLEEIQAELEAEIKRKAAEALKNAGQQQVPPEQIYTGGKLAWPCPSSYMITSGYGQRWGKLHGGIDISAPKGTPIVAAESGIAIIVNTSGWGGGYGLYVVIAHDDTLTTLYGHMSETAVSVGDVVSRGQTIGYVGSTGNSTGNHLHFEVRINGSRQDPINYIT